jgi:hypothetical protein
MRAEHLQEHVFKGLEEEQALLGHKLDWENLLKKNEIPHQRKPFREWIQIVQDIYPENPIVPQRKWGKDLYNFVADKLELDIDDIESLKFYKTLGTDLDKMGVDCFFIFKNPETGKEAIFTIDITVNPQKDEAKSDMTIKTDEIPDHRKDEENYIQEMQQLADHIAEALKSKTELTH